MADSFTVSEIKIEDQQADPRTDRMSISGVVMLRAEYGDTALSFGVKFDHMPSANAAILHALRHAGNIGHFIEYHAGDLERRNKT